MQPFTPAALYHRVPVNDADDESAAGPSVEQRSTEAWEEVLERLIVDHAKERSIACVSGQAKSLPLWCALVASLLAACLVALLCSPTMYGATQHWMGRNGSFVLSLSHATRPARPSFLSHLSSATPLSLSNHTRRFHLALQATEHKQPWQLFLEFIRPYHNTNSTQYHHLLYHPRPAPLSSTDRSIVLLDGREEWETLLVLRHTLYLSGPEWGMVIFHIPSNLEWFRRELEVWPGGWGEHIKFVPVDQITWAQANALPTSAVFYQHIPTEHILIVQKDVVQLRSTYLPGVSTSSQLSEWMERYHYLGAPWPSIWCDANWCRAGGNGGCSYRRRSSMLEMVNALPLRCGERHCSEEAPFASAQSNEDLLITEQVWKQHELGRWNIPGDTREMARFSVEGLDFPGIHPFFMHAAWKFLTDESRVEELFSHVWQYYPE